MSYKENQTYSRVINTELVLNRIVRKGVTLDLGLSVQVKEQRRRSLHLPLTTKRGQRRLEPVAMVTMALK